MTMILESIALCLAALLATAGAAPLTGTSFFQNCLNDVPNCKFSK